MEEGVELRVNSGSRVSLVVTRVLCVGESSRAVTKAAPCYVRTMHTNVCAYGTGGEYV